MGSGWGVRTLHMVKDGILPIRIWNLLQGGTNKSLWSSLQQ